jgi:hypothetical protein
MVTAIVQFKLPAAISRQKAAELFAGSAARYRQVPGLIRKYYLLSEDGGSAGGVYLWQCREDAERMYTPQWKAFVKDRYGTEPQIAYFESPVIVDNLSGQIIAS